MIEARLQNPDFVFQKGEKHHPERVARRLYGNGKRANFPAEIPADAPRSVGELLTLYRPNDEKFGENSLAQLFPSKHDFEALTIKGLDLVYHQTKAKVTVHINTIDELRTLFEVLDETPNIRVFVHRQSERELSNRLDLAVMRNLLSAWDVISDGSMQQGPR